MSEKLGNICRAQSLRTSGSYSSSTRFPKKLSKLLPFAEQEGLAPYPQSQPLNPLS